jgi:hypothetical protein
VTCSPISSQSFAATTPAALEHPEHGERADRVGRDGLSPLGQAQRQPLETRDQSQAAGNEEQLAGEAVRSGSRHFSSIRAPVILSAMRPGTGST